MGFSLIFNIYEAYVKEQNIMTTDNINEDMDRIIELAKEVLISNGAEYFGAEEIKMRICYPTIINENVFLFNKSGDKIAHVLCRNKISEEDFDAIVNEVDDHFLTISEKSKILNFRQTYTINNQIFKIGDVHFKLGSLQKDILNRFIFLEIINPYLNRYEEIKEFSYEITQSLFFDNMKPYCLFDSTIEKLYKEQKLKVNQHWEILQYVQLLKK